MSRNAILLALLATPLGACFDDSELLIDWQYLRKELDLHRAPVVSLDFSAAQNLLASAGDDGEVILWEMPGGNAKARLPGAGRRVWFSPDGRDLACAEEDGLAIRNSSSGEIRGKLPVTGVGSLAFSADGTMLFIADPEGRAVRRFDLATWAELDSLAADPALPDSLDAVAVSPDGGTLLAGFQSGALQTWELPSARPALSWFDPSSVPPFPYGCGPIVVSFHPATGAVFWFGLGFFEFLLPRAEVVRTQMDWICAADAEFSPDGGVIAFDSRSDSENPLLFYTAFGYFVRDGPAGITGFGIRAHLKPVRATRCSDGSTLLSASEDRKIRVWDLSRLPVWDRL